MGIRGTKESLRILESHNLDVSLSPSTVFVDGHLSVEIEGQMVHMGVCEEQP